MSCSNLSPNSSSGTDEETQLFNQVKDFKVTSTPESETESGYTTNDSKNSNAEIDNLDGIDDIDDESDEYTPQVNGLVDGLDPTPRVVSRGKPSNSNSNISREGIQGTEEEGQISQQNGTSDIAQGLVQNFPNLSQLKHGFEGLPDLRKSLNSDAMHLAKQIHQIMLSSTSGNSNSDSSSQKYSYNGHKDKSSNSENNNNLNGEEVLYSNYKEYNLEDSEEDSDEPGDSVDDREPKTGQSYRNAMLQNLENDETYRTDNDNSEYIFRDVYDPVSSSGTSSESEDFRERISPNNSNFKKDVPKIIARPFVRGMDSNNSDISSGAIELQNSSYDVKDDRYGEGYRYDNGFLGFY